MRFDELNEDNYILFAIKNYDNPQAATKEDFFEDMRRFKYIKRLLKKYHKGTCLLYTSPSPRDKRQSRMPSSA